MRVKTWKILDPGEVPATARTIPFTCRCGREAYLPVLGRPIAVTAGAGHRGDGGILFDPGPHASPTKVQCRKCGRVLVLWEPDHVG